MYLIQRKVLSACARSKKVAFPFHFFYLAYFTQSQEVKISGVRLDNSIKSPYFLILIFWKVSSNFKKIKCDKPNAIKEASPILNLDVNDAKFISYIPIGIIYD